ncbi:MAG: glycogen-binding domain-containing protein [Candidatus Cloacimonetes bacterium]|nr:glycogen-binding domain-containing protein [Candidatus Cloacimonadota bacterium]
MKKILFISFLLLSAVLLLAAVKETADGVEFTYSAPNAGSVSLAGSFNDWSTTADPMQKQSDGSWMVIMDLPEGSHSYKFVIDGNWMYDAENPLTIDDGYGGSNSLVEVGGGNVKPAVAAKKVSLDVASGINPKVYFDGRYYASYKLSKDENMNRYELAKPYHDLNLGIMIKMNENVEGYTLLNANNTNEGVDMWKTHLNFKRTWLKMDADYINLFAFDDYGVIKFDDPMNIVGNYGYNGYNFGWDYRGILFNTDSERFALTRKLPFKFEIEGFGADKQGNDERDITAVRFKADYDFKLFQCRRNFTLGGSSYNSRLNNQAGNPITADPVYIVDSNPAWEIDGMLTSIREDAGWQSPMKMYLGYEHFAFENKKEYKDYHSEGYDFIAEKEFVWQEGSKDFLFLKVKFPAALQVYAGYTSNEIKFNYEAYPDTAVVIPAADVNHATLSRSKWALKADFELNKLNLTLGMERWSTEYPDSVATWSDYYKYMERTDGNGRWYQDYNELTFARYLLLGYDTGLIWNFKSTYNWKKLSLEYEANIAQLDFGYQPELIENFIRIKWDINNKWTLQRDTRIPIYNSELLGLKTDFANDKDVFRACYTELRYHLGENVSLAFGYGINPRVISSVSDEFYNDGRREYLETEGNLDEYLQITYNRFGEQLRKAENALEDDYRISIEAVLQF